MAELPRAFYNFHRCQPLGIRTLSESFMGCKLVRGETIYFVRHAGRTAGDLECDWFHDDVDQRLLPAVFVRSDGHSASASPAAALPIEIRNFEGS